ncbi:hypothetical protein CFC21_015377 [Triticum aestivum]|uniref:Uncharacterized protein n=4 Tax=Triticum TaxID=4564 RepID=A0A9R1NK04_TRITD|nr:hypothetical protein TRIUR3_12055 [Triticum urartu]KAF6999333.1 hypothetical protein CFC21_015377 [Triticum aestivum]VAH26367.1 unnamed protein product [Triticum turgidum subsp. durum]
MAQATGMESTAYASSCDMENEKVRDDSTIFLISNGNLRLQEARQMHNSSRWIRRRFHLCHAPTLVPILTSEVLFVQAVCQQIFALSSQLRDLSLLAKWQILHCFRFRKPDR